VTANCSQRCDACGVVVEGADLDAFSDAYVAHVRSRHPDWSYPEVAIRNVAEATQRLTGSTARLGTIGAVTIHPVSEERIGDWLAFFDHDGFAGNPVDAVCYCSSPHLSRPGQDGGAEMRPWRENRKITAGLLRSGRAFGYLVYVDGRPAGWVNASTRSECPQVRLDEHVDCSDETVICIACFVIAPPYRRHGLAKALLTRVLADAPARNATYVEAYPLNSPAESDAGNNRGHRSLFDAHEFHVIQERQHDTIMRRFVEAN
jgi:GNAT superfamily N-acetyltransferase